MRVSDSEEGQRIARLVLLVDNDVLGSSNLLSITNHSNSNLINIRIRKIVATPVRIWIKVKRDLTTLIRWQGSGQLECLLIKMKSWMRVALIMLGNTTIKGISKAPVVMNVQLGISRMQTLGRNNRASLMDEFSTQDIRVRATTTIDRRIECLANRSHSKGVVIKKDMLAKGRTNIISASEEVKKVMRNRLKIGKNDFALITAHAKLGIDVGGVRKSFSSPMEGMAEREIGRA